MAQAIRAVAPVRTAAEHDRTLFRHVVRDAKARYRHIMESLGVRLDRRTTPRGEVSLAASSCHRVRVHAGAPVRGACGHHRFRYTRGDLDVLPSGFSDVWHDEDACSSLLIELPTTLFRRAAEDAGRDPDRVVLAARHQFRDRQIEHIAGALDTHRRAGQPNGPLYEELLGLALALHLLGQLATPDRAPRGLSRPQLRRLTEFIEAHLDERLSLQRLAAVAGVSASHLKTLFKRSTGVPVHQFVIQRRVDRARRLLARGELSVSQIALDVGFAHQSHMARHMRRLLGTSPGAIARGKG